MNERGAMNLVSLESETWKLPIWGGALYSSMVTKFGFGLGTKEASKPSPSSCARCVCRRGQFRRIPPATVSWMYGQVEEGGRGPLSLQEEMKMGWAQWEGS